MKNFSLALVGLTLLACVALAAPGLALAETVAGAASTDAEAEPRMVREAVAVARQLRQSDNAFDQIAAAGTLVDVGDKEALQFLSDTMDHTDWALMRSAIDMLLNVQHPAGVDLIYRAAQRNRDGVFVKFLSESLATRPREDMAEFLMGAMAGTDSWVKKHALQALARLPFTDKEARVRAIAEDDAQDSMTRAYAYYVLMDTPARTQSLERLLHLADEGSPDAQEAAAVGLGLVKNDQTRAALQRLESSSNARAQLAAFASEAGFGETGAIAYIVEAITHGTGMDSSVAAASVRRMPPPVAIHISEQVTGCCKLDTEVAARLLESWATIDADPTRMLEWGLTHADPAVRMQAVWLVGERRERAWLKRIAPMLRDEDSGIRSMAAWAIVRVLGDEYDAGVEI
ncbi:MAG: HEAT repeat domain-containing protein [Gammaproteobacteria bacterium]